MKNLSPLLFFLLIFQGLFAQNSKSIDLEQGQIMDVLPLKFNPNADSLSIRKYSKVKLTNEIGYGF